MISNFSSFVELFAAIYVTMAVNNDFCSNFWTPQYYKEMDSLLNKYDFAGSSSIHNRLMSEIKLKYENVQNRAHYRGFIVLMLCIFYLIFMGYEDETNSNLVQQYIPILSCTLLVGLTLVFSNFVLKNWKYTVLCVVFYVLTYIFLKIVHFDLLETNICVITIFKNKPILLILIILLPIVHQLYIYWLYSSVYKGYLKYHVSKEYKRYKESMLGIKTKDKSKVDRIYMEAWSDAKFSSNQDPTYTTFYNVLTKQLLFVASPSHWQLFISWIKHHKRRIFSNDNESISFRLEDVFEETASNNPLVKYEYKKSTLDFTEEYEKYINWKKIGGKSKNLKSFCSEYRVSYKDMSAWLRVNKPKL